MSDFINKARDEAERRDLFNNDAEIFIEGAEWAQTIAEENDRQAAEKIANVKRELRAHAARLREEHYE